MQVNKKTVTALLVLFLILGFGTFGYIIIEDYTMFEGLYMSMITVTTVGYGEVRPLSNAGRGFTSLLIVLGFIGIAYVGRVFAESLLETLWTGSLEIKKMKKKIDKLKNHYIVCGYGRVGSASAKHLHESGVKFVVIEANHDYCQKIKEKGYLYVEGDATDENCMIDAGVKSATGLLSLLNSDPDNLFLVLTARELNPTLHIISRADSPSSEKKIFRAGADKVISPFSSAGKKVAASILGATGNLAVSNNKLLKQNFVPRWVTIAEKNEMVGRTIKEISKTTGQEVIGLRRNGNDSIYPDESIHLNVSDQLLVIAEKNKPEELLLKSEKLPKIVIVDDSPIILSLFSRLFKQKGFLPITAIDGKKGYEIIIKEQPVAAVVDYMLPEMSGMEVCKKIRQNDTHKNIKLIMFTSDKAPETQKKAIDCGANAIVVKSPESSEIIETVLRVIEENGTREDNKKSDTLKTNIERKTDLSAEEKKNERKTDKSTPPVNLVKAFEIMDDDNDFLKECFADFLSTSPETVKEITDAVEQKNADALDKSAHKLKGTLIYIAAEKAAETAYKLEEMGKKQNLETADEELDHLKKQLSEVEAFVMDYIKV